MVINNRKNDFKNVKLKYPLDMDLKTRPQITIIILENFNISPTDIYHTWTYTLYYICSHQMKNYDPVYLPDWNQCRHRLYSTNHN